MMQKLNRQDQTYILAKALKQRGLNPDSNLYKGAIVRICAVHFQLPKARVDELTRILTSAYKADRWAHILGETDETPQTPTLTVTEQYILKAATKKEENKTAKENISILRGIAKRDTYDYVGRLILKEAQLEIGPVTAQEIIDTWQTHYPKDTVEQSGNVLLIYWGGKERIEEKRDGRTIQFKPRKYVLKASVPDTYKDNFEKDALYADDKVGDVVEMEDE